MLSLFLDMLVILSVGMTHMCWVMVVDFFGKLYQFLKKKFRIDVTVQFCTYYFHVTK